MSLSFESVVGMFPGAEVVGGQILVRVEGKMVTIGELTGDVFNLTDAGRAAVKTLQEPATDAPSDAAPEGKKK